MSNNSQDELFNPFLWLLLLFFSIMGLLGFLGIIYDWLNNIGISGPVAVYGCYCFIAAPISSFLFFLIDHYECTGRWQNAKRINKFFHLAFWTSLPLSLGCSIVSAVLVSLFFRFRKNSSASKKTTRHPEVKEMELSSSSSSVSNPVMPESVSFIGTGANAITTKSSNAAPAHMHEAYSQKRSPSSLFHYLFALTDIFEYKVCDFPSIMERAYLFAFYFYVSVKVIQNQFVVSYLYKNLGSELHCYFSNRYRGADAYVVFINAYMRIAPYINESKINPLTSDGREGLWSMLIQWIYIPEDRFFTAHELFIRDTLLLPRRIETFIQNGIIGDCSLRNSITHIPE